MHHLFVSLLLASCITLVAPQVSFDSDRSEALSIFRHWDLFKSKRSQGGSNSNLNVHSCATQQSWLEVSKEEHSASTGQLIRICHGRLQVAKCEGSCLSNLRPSINTLTGLIKVGQSIVQLHFFENIITVFFSSLTHSL